MKVTIKAIVALATSVLAFEFAETNSAVSHNLPTPTFN